MSLYLEKVCFKQQKYKTLKTNHCSSIDSTCQFNSLKNKLLKIEITRKQGDLKNDMFRGNEKRNALKCHPYIICMFPRKAGKEKRMLNGRNAMRNRVRAIFYSAFFRLLTFPSLIAYGQAISHIQA